MAVSLIVRGEQVTPIIARCRRKCTCFDAQNLYTRYVPLIGSHGSIKTMFFWQVRVKVQLQLHFGAVS